MNSRRIFTLALIAAGLGSMAGSAAAGPRHWFYDFYGAYNRGAVVQFGFWSGPQWLIPGFFYPSPPREHDEAFPPLYPGEKPVEPDRYREVAPGRYAPIHGNNRNNAATHRGNAKASSNRQAPKASAIKPPRAVSNVPEPRSTPTAPEKLVTTAPQPTIVEKEAPVGKVSGGRISCDKARRIVSGFGFSDVHALACSGKEYGFSAKRDGKDFDIRLSSLTGELIRVKRR